jgi:hypothetical protein
MAACAVFDAASPLAEPPPMIGKLLGHAKMASTTVYPHLEDRSACEAA